MERFNDHKTGFRQIFRDRNWFPKLMLAGFLLINPFLVALAPAYFEGHPHWVQLVFPFILGFNVLSFWFPLGFTFEVLRRARTGRGAQLPNWSRELLPRYAYEGSMKFIIALPTIIAPILLWMGFCWLIFVHTLNLPIGMLSMFLPPVLLLVIPMCAVACCRWLDGESVLMCAFDLRTNLRFLVTGFADFAIATAFIIGVNSITTAFYYTLPFGVVFGLCLVDTWFGPTYSQIARYRASQPAVNNGKPPGGKNDKMREKNSSPKQVSKSR